jgi:RNA polymerase sigma-70 factor (ECF subfamily)
LLARARTETTAATTDLEEVRLVRRARGGDVAAFEGLYRRFARRVHGLCFRMTGDRDQAEELTQETFVRVWQRLDRFEGDARFGPWLLKVAANLVLDHRRTRSRKHDRELGTDRLDRVPGPAPEPRAGAGAGLDLERAIGALPERARAVFVLHDVEGLRHAEISELLGVAVGTTKAQLHRARRMLRDTLS